METGTHGVRFLTLLWSRPQKWLSSTNFLVELNHFCGPSRLKNASVATDRVMPMMVTVSRLGVNVGLSEISCVRPGSTETAS